MTDDGTLTYSWDRGGRLLSAGGSSYAYNGLGNRLSQTVSAVVTDYLLDLQPGLSKVLAATTGANMDRFVHTPQGIHAQHDATNGWQWMIQDGLGSVRAVVDSSFDVDESRHYGPYGEPWGVQGSSQTDFGFTGEPTDDNGLVHLRARYLNPSLGVFPSLDPVEGALQDAMSLNGYGYVAGNVVNMVDLSGTIRESPNRWNSCQSDSDCTCYSGEMYHLCRLGRLSPCSSAPMPPTSPSAARPMPPSINESERKAIILAVGLEAPNLTDGETEIVLHMILNHMTLPAGNPSYWPSIEDKVGTDQIAAGAICCWGSTREEIISRTYDCYVEGNCPIQHCDCVDVHPPNPHSNFSNGQVVEFVDTFLSNPRADFTGGVLQYVHLKGARAQLGPDAATDLAAEIALDMRACARTPTSVVDSDGHTESYLEYDSERLSGIVFFVNGDEIVVESLGITVYTNVNVTPPQTRYRVNQAGEFLLDDHGQKIKVWNCPEVNGRN